MIDTFSALILTHLIVGSEGTLGFVAEAVFQTIPLLTHITTGLLVFPDLEAANAALPKTHRLPSNLAVVCLRMDLPEQRFVCR